MKILQNENIRPMWESYHTFLQNEKSADLSTYSELTEIHAVKAFASVQSPFNSS